MKRLLLFVVVIVAAVLAWANLPGTPLPAGTKADRVVVAKGARTLSLYQGERLLKTYRVSLGGNPLGHKQREGDQRTPEGRYRLDARNPHSDYHLALHVSYPEAADIASAKQRGVSPGGEIMVHGTPNGYGWIGKLQRYRDWTAGCIALTDPEIEEIWAAVPDGTPIEINP